MTSRGFSAEDMVTPGDALLVNQTLAARYFAGEEAGTPGRDSEAALWLGDGDEVD